MVFATLWHVHLSFCTVFAIFLAPQPLISLILHGMCYMLVLQTNFHVGFLSGVTFSICRVSLGFHLELQVSFGCHLIYRQGLILNLLGFLWGVM